MASTGGSAKPKKLSLSPNAAVEDTLDNEFGQGAIAGPSSPSRRRRRPSASRRRSSSITAAASLISSYSTSPPTAHPTAASPIEYDTLNGRSDTQQGSLKRQASHVKRPSGDGNDSLEDDSQEEFGEDALETAREATRAFRKGKSSPYHMALVSLLFSLAQGMPLASQFKVYAYMMCQLYKARYAGSKMVRESFVQAKLIAVGTSSLPPAPDLPASRVCENIWVDNATSTYAAAMAMVGALLSLILLNRCSRLSDYFGRKPLLLGTHVLLALSTTVFRLSVFLPTYVGVGVLYVAVMILEASAGAPLKIAIQNYVMDTTSETQRAGALSFTDGFGQLGAFPSSTLGGWLAVVTQKFFAPFYASIAVYALSTVYVLLFVPESKKKRHHTLIDGFERVGSSSNANAWRQNSVRAQQQHGNNNDDDTTDDDADTDGGVARTESYFSSVYDPNDSEPYWKKFVHRFNFLAPLAVFIPDCQTASATRQSRGRKWRLSILALIVILEESYQVFMIPVILLYNTSVFHYDVVQNGYLVSLLQGVRALYLTVFFPWAVSKARAWAKRRKDRASSAADQTEPDERTPLQESTLQSGQEDENDDDDQREERGRLDVIIMLASYLISAASFVLMAMTRKWYERKSEQNSGLPSWAEVAIAIVGLQIGAGATSLRTALLVNAVSEQADEQELLAHQQAVQQRRATAQQYGSSASPRITRHFSALSSSAQSNTDGGASNFHVHHERHQSKALAANQILCTAVYAIVPLITSRIFGVGIAMHKPELVWLFKAAMALFAALTSLALLFSYKRK